MVLGLDISTSVIGYALFNDQEELQEIGWVDLVKYKDLNENMKLMKNISYQSLFKHTFKIYKKLILNGYGQRSHLELLRYYKDVK